jgi:uncharacterized membrane protein YbhN (UPF0104 family)
MKRLRERPVSLTVLALAIAAAAVIAIAAVYGFQPFANAWTHVHAGWLALVIGGELVAVPAYAITYRTLAEMRDGPRLTMQLVLRIVIAGFGPFWPGGGFALDRKALQAIDGDERAATIRVLGLGAIEWAVLAPAACVAAIVLLILGDQKPMSSLLWPWALAVPIGFAIGFWLAAPGRRDRIAGDGNGWRGGLGRTLESVGLLPGLARSFATCWEAWIGVALYWALDIASFYGAVRLIGLRPNLGETILGYATGYALTRRSMPLGGAGVTEALMTFALHWVGQPVMPALAAVVVYRVFNFALPAIPALSIHDRVQPLVAAAEEDRRLSARARRRAAEPIGSR